MEQLDDSVTPEMKTSGQLASPDSMYVFLTSVGKYSLAIDAEQVSELVLFTEGVPPLSASEKYVGNDGVLPVISPAYVLNEDIPALVKPRLVKFKNKGKAYGLLVEEPRILQKILIKDIKPTPPLLTVLRANALLWGIFELHDDLYFILDLKRIQL